jgi:hypothetical protein
MKFREASRGGGLFTVSDEKAQIGARRYFLGGICGGPDLGSRNPIFVLTGSGETMS